MTDLTIFFTQLCDTYAAEHHSSVKHNATPKRHILTDTFQDECLSLKLHLSELKSLILDVKPLYLSADKKLMSDLEIKQLDEDIKIQLKEFTNKHNFLQQYELERYNNLVENRSHFKLNGFIKKAKGKLLKEFQERDFDTGSYDEQLFLSNHRQGCLAFLSLKIVEISDIFGNLQKEKFLKEQKLNDLDFKMIHKQINLHRNENYNSESADLEDVVAENIDNVSYSSGYRKINEVRENEAIEYQETLKMLTQEQVQELAIENDNIIQGKDNQLNELNEISKKLFEISSLTNELNLQLSQQSQNINLILDNQDSVNLELKQANRQLNSSSGKMNFSAVLVSYMAIIIGILILFLDYIN